MWRPRASRPYWLVLAMITAACTSPQMPPTAQTETPIRGGRVVHGQVIDVNNFQPALGTTVYPRLVYEPLLEPHPTTGGPMPRLATWRISPDALTYTFELRAATWSDGSAVTPRDWLTTLKGIARTKRPA